MANGAYGDLGGRYGAKAAPFAGGQRKRMNINAVCLSLFMPWLIFVSVYALFSFQIHYASPVLCYLLAFAGLALAIAFGVLALNALRARAAGDTTREPSWLVFIFLSSLGAWCMAVVIGDYNFWHNMQPFYDVQNLNSYPNVDAGRMRGQQMMDAGRIMFTEGTHLDLSKSMGFKNLETYCVAPITSSDDLQATYDFWAVGLNCCAGQATDFQCGEYNNPQAVSGLRLMRDDQRAFYRLAVEQAESAFDIRAPHPLFFHWMQDPETELQSYHEDGHKYFLLGIFSHFALQLFLVVLAVIGFSKIA